VTLQTATIVLVTVLLATYLVLDGGDLGIGILCPFLGRNCGQRSVLRTAAGPVWNGNEAWLMLAGLIACIGFPGFGSAALEDFIPAVVLVVAALALRALAAEMSRGDTASGAIWDAVFFLGSLAPALVFGAAAGTLMMSLRAEPTGGYAGGLATLLDPFGALVAVTGLALFVMHGAAWSALRTEGQVRNRSRTVLNVASVTLIGLLVTLAAVCALTLEEFSSNLLARPAGRLSLAVLVAALVLLRIALRRRLELFAWVCSAAVIAALAGLAAVGAYPFHIPAGAAQAGAGLTLQAAAAAPSTLSALLVGAAAAAALLVMYAVWAYRASEGRATPTPHGPVLVRRREIPDTRRQPAQRSQ